jgi:DNA-binding protein HU-beta
MNKAELINAIAKKVSGTSKRAAGEMVDAFTSIVEGALRKGGSVTLVGFGTFSTGKRAARIGRNPRTGEQVRIPAARTAKFSAGTGLKKAVNKK